MNGFKEMLLLSVLMLTVIQGGAEEGILPMDQSGAASHGERSEGLVVPSSREAALFPGVPCARGKTK